MSISICEMVLLLPEQLDVPIRERNSLLLAAISEAVIVGMLVRLRK